MKVALIDPSLFTAPYDLELMKGLREVGAEPRLYTKRLTRADPIGPAPDIVEHFYRGLAPLPDLPAPLGRVLKGLSHTADMARLAGALARWRPDIIHFQWVPLPAVDRLFLRRLRAIAPLVLTVHDSNPYYGAPGTTAQRFGARRILNEFDALLVHTEHARARLEEHGIPPAKLARVAHGRLHERLELGERRHSAAAASGTIEFLMFGKLKPYKGLDVLIRAVAELSPALRARCRVRVVGKPYMDVGPLLALAAARGVSERFEFDFRFVEDEEMPALFDRADAIVFPYRDIDASGVLMTALSTGKPIVATRVGLFGELLVDGETALVTPSDDPAALALALGRLIEDEPLRQRLAAAARECDRNIPSWAEIARATRTVYERAGLASATG
ncbi:MAG TPA: glycosyltransferase family 4 protein [Stellaceae bacterium]|nr:glycosyltransferase family 4 protein [Stellaceae bacterium]